MSNYLDYLNEQTKIIISNRDMEYSVTLKNGLGGQTEDAFEAMLGLLVAAGHHSKSIEDIIVQRAYEIEPPEEEDKYSFVEELLDRYPKEHERGFMMSEVEHILLFFSDGDFNIQKYNDAMTGNTGAVTDEGHFLTYHTDLRRALICGIEGRSLTAGEFD